MPTKSSGSHASGHLLSLVASALLVEHITTFLPSFLEISKIAGELFARVTGVVLPNQISGMFLISIILMALWGIGYHFYRN